MSRSPSAPAVQQAPTRALPPLAGSTLALIDPASGSVSRLDTPFTSYTGPTLAVHEVRAGWEGGKGRGGRAGWC